MKKSYILIFILSMLILAFILVLYRYYNKSRREYYNSFNSIQNVKTGARYELLLSQYFFDNWECAKNLEEVIPYESHDPKYESLKERYFKDFLSSRKGFINYVPLYNRLNLKREAFLIISAGIDGKINNVINEEDTIFIDEFEEKFRFYNPAGEIIPNNHLPDPDSTFHLMKLLFGKKDYIIQYIDCIELFKSQTIGTIPIHKLVDFLDKENGRIREEFFTYKGVVYNDTVINKGKYILFRSNNYRIWNKLYYDTIQEIYLGDSVAFTGEFIRIDPEKKLIHFEKCIQVPLDYKPSQ